MTTFNFTFTISVTVALEEDNEYEAAAQLIEEMDSLIFADNRLVSYIHPGCAIKEQQ